MSKNIGKISWKFTLKALALRSEGSRGCNLAEGCKFKLTCTEKSLKSCYIENTLIRYNEHVPLLVSHSVSGNYLQLERRGAHRISSIFDGLVSDGKYIANFNDDIELCDWCLEVTQMFWQEIISELANHNRPGRFSV